MLHIMNDTKGSSDEAIGRPPDWREGRYERPGKPVDTAVNDPSQKAPPSPDPASTPVTREDYEQRKPPS
jgi:hypothetical protein